MTAAGAPHPFPPVVRWAVFPALAALAGAAGGATSLRVIVIFGLLAAGAAVGSMLSRKRWVFLVAAPLMGPLAACSGLSLLSAFQGSSWQMLMSLLQEPGTLILVMGAACLQGAAHTLLLHRDPPATALRTAAHYVIAGAAIALLSMATLRSSEAIPLAGFFFLSTALQTFSFRASLALAGRLRRSEGP